MMGNATKKDIENHPSYDHHNAIVVERVRYNPQVRPGYFLGDDPVG
jgi:hypothetical protein